MLGLLRRQRLLAPVLFGTMLTGGCQLFGTNAPSSPRSGAIDGKIVNSQQTDSAVSPRKGAGPELPPVVETNGSGRGDDGRPVSSLRSSTEGKEATTVTRISSTPDASTGGSSRTIDLSTLPPGTRTTVTSSTVANPSNAVPAASGPAGQVVRTDARQQTAPGTPNRLPTGSAEEQTDRADEMTMKYRSGSDDAIKRMELRLQSLEQRLELGDRAVRQSGVEVKAATEEVQRTRVQNEGLRKEADELRIKLRNRDKEEIESLKTQIETARRLIGKEPPTP